MALAQDPPPVATASTLHHLMQVCLLLCSSLFLSLSTLASPATAAPQVTLQAPAIDPSTKEIQYNPTYEELFAPQVRVVGPAEDRLRGLLKIAMIV